MPWNEPGGGNRNPWERRPGQGGSELDEIVRGWQRRLAGIFGGGRTGRPAGAAGGINWGAIALLIAAFWGATGFYMVDAAERAVVLRFGRYAATSEQGLHWHWPWPIERVAKVNVAKNDSIDDKTRMLTADENLVDISIAVQFIRADPLKFLFNVRDPESTLRDVSESAIREAIGQSTLEFVLGAGRQEITERTKGLIQKVLDGYQTGIQIISVNLTGVNVPDQVAPSQKDAIKAREDRDRFGQEAQAYTNDVVPRARGSASRQLQDAQAYRARVVAEAEGDTSRFGQMLTAYQRAPDVTRQRLYLETVEAVLGRSRKVFLDTKSGGNVLYLPIDKLLEKSTGSSDAAALLAPGMTRPDQPTETITVDPRARGDR
ncbi:MAG TPA: FtsH protease activity modulator HflK [Steroidobacteraceae bacterium]|jgi:membrane protease subunit HflK|nr:FtsH protease activity modulator HflK [Steroidobacteraceae bacterium]